MASTKELHHRSGVEFEQHLDDLNLSGGMYLELQKLDKNYGNIGRFNEQKTS